MRYIYRSHVDPTHNFILLHGLRRNLSSSFIDTLLDQGSSTQTYDFLADLQLFCIGLTFQLIISSYWRWIEGLATDDGIILLGRLAE